VKILKDDFLHALESVTPGLSHKDTIEQSSCFVFKGGQVHTFNQKVYCRCDLELGVEGAVSAKPLLKLLTKLTDESVSVSVKDGHLRIKYQDGAINHRLQQEILLPVDQVPHPDEWLPLPEQFSDALDLVQECAGTDLKKYVTTCVHVHPKYLEATDSVQAARYRLKTGVKTPCIVERDTLKCVVASGVSEVAESESWLHYRSKEGLVIYCRRMLEEYADLGDCYLVEGDRAVLPKSLAEAADKAEVFSSEDKDDGRLLVEIRSGRIKVFGQGVSGFAEEFKDAAYEGPDLKFLIAPKILTRIVEKGQEIIIGPTRIMIDGGSHRYVTALAPPEEK